MKSFTVCFICLMIVVLCTSSIAQINWEKHKDNPVLTPGAMGEWDELFASIPSVLFDGSMYHLWYSKYDFNAGRFTGIGYATSNDGISWTKYDNPATTEPPYSQSDPVLLPGDTGSYDSIGVGQPSVLKFGNVYHMWYTGDNHVAGSQGLSICHATSLDGITWTKDPNNPVLDVGSNGEWDDAWVNAPSIVFDGSVYHMWYGGWDGNAPPDNVRIGHAIAPHPDSTWTKDANNPVLNEGISGCWDYDRVDAPDVVYDGTMFHMFYSGGFMFNWRIGYAWSTDGTQWTKYNNPNTAYPIFNISDPVLLWGSNGTWDDINVSHCSVILDTLSDSLKMWYTGADAAPGTAQVGYATAPVSIHHVPGNYSTIQAAINAANDGDVVLVDEGTYYENINFKGKAITVASHFWFDGDTSHISKTIIDGSQPANPDSGSVVYFISGEDTTSVLCGFTITGGSGTYDSNLDARGGGGIFMWDSGGRIYHNIITNNHVSYNGLTAGGGLLYFVQNKNYNLIIEDNTFTHNSISSSSIIASGGGGILCKWSASSGGKIRIHNNTISYNTVTNQGRYKALGGGINFSIDLPNSVDAVIENNLITYNELHCVAAMGAGIYVVYWEPEEPITDLIPTPVIRNNIIANNYSEDRGAGIGIWTVFHSTSSVINPQPAIINNTIVNNKASDGSGIFNFRSFPLLMNNILWNDLSINGSREIFNDDIDYPDYKGKINMGELFMYYSDIQGGWEGEGNRNVEPLFADTANGDFNLLEGSPGIGWATDSVTINDHTYFCPPLDKKGKSRPHTIDKNPDMGALESPYITDISKEKIFAPDEFDLMQNYPNPFNPSTTIEFTLPKSEFVELKVYNILGKEVSTLVSMKMNQGNHTCTFEGKNLASGIYYYQLVAGDYRDVKKMIHLK